MKILFMIVALGLSMPVLSATTYKCSKNGVMSYQFKACDEASQQVIIEDKQPKKEEIDAGGTLEKDILLGEFSVKTNPREDSKYQQFSYKVLVTNRTNSVKKVSLEYKAIDSQGFQITNRHLLGTIQPLSSETLTDTGIIDGSDFDRIQKWVLDK
jgi:hypothetical protein